MALRGVFVYEEGQIRKIDSTNEIAVLESLPKQLKEGLELGKGIKAVGPFKNIVFCGMGGSAIPAEVVRDSIDLDIPIIIVKNYNVPKCVGRNSLVFAISYSGNTEETIECYDICKKRNCTLVALSSGGKLKELAFKDEVPHVFIPGGIQPRDALGHMCAAILNVLYGMRLIANPENDVYDAIKSITPNLEDNAKDLANRLVNKIPIIYSSEDMAIVSRIWKIKFNENSKIMAFANQFPEFNHNEIEGYENLKGNFYVIIIKDKSDHPRVQKRMDILKGIIQNHGVPVLMINLAGKNKFARIMSATALAGYTSFYLAMQYNTDPAPVKDVELLKKQMKL